MKTITINQKQYPIKGGYSAIRNYCIRRKIEFYEFFDKLQQIATEKPTIDTLDTYGYLVLSFVDRGCELEGKQNDLTLNDVIDWFGEDEKNLTSVIEMLTGDLGGQSEKKAKVSR